MAGAPDEPQGARCAPAPGARARVARGRLGPRRDRWGGGRGARRAPRRRRRGRVRPPLPAPRLSRGLRRRNRPVRVPMPSRRVRCPDRCRALRSATPRSHAGGGGRMTSLASLRRSGHWPTLLAAFVYFDVSFAFWYLLGPLANFIADDLRLSATTKGLLVATPLLGGSLFRIVLGALSDHLGPRRTGLVGIALTFVPLLLGWLVAGSLPSLLVVALLLGIPGASFAVALPLASRWDPPAQRGRGMGTAGAGNSRTVLAALLAPRLAAAHGWHAAIGLAMVPMGLAGLVFLCCARESP